MVWGFLILIIQEFSCVTGQATYFYLLTYFWLLNYFRGLNSGVVGRLLVLWSRENKEILPEGRASFTEFRFMLCLCNTGSNMGFLK